MMQHTPGPWKVEKYTSHPHYEIFGVICPGSTIPQRVCYLQDHMAENEANALLIAASPELLDILEHIVLAHETGNNGAINGEAILCPAFAERGRDIINKAKGR